MPRDLSTEFVNSLEAQESDDVSLLFATITHAVLLEPIRVVNDVVDYLLVGNRYLGLPFQAELLTDNEKPPRGVLAIPNVDEMIGQAIRLLDSPPRLKLEVYSLADFGEVEFIDDRKTRQVKSNISPTIPVPEYSADFLTLHSVQLDVAMVRADIGSFDPSLEPYPKIRATLDRLPGLFR